MATKKSDWAAGALFLLPAYVPYALFFLAPIAITFIVAFYEVDRFTLKADFVGLDNFYYVYTDTRFWRALVNTFVFVLEAETLNVFIGLVLAVLLNRSLPRFALYFFRLSFFAPVLISLAFASYIWQFLFSTDLGAINYYLVELGLPRLGWLTDSHVSMYAVVILDVWKNCGFFMIIFLAALQEVPKEIIEAAELDGAGGFTIFFKITIPIIRPVILFAIAYSTITGLQVYDSIRVLTNGGPGDSTLSLVMYMVQQGLGTGDISFAAVGSLTLVAVISVVAAVQVWLGRKWATL